MTVNEGPLLGVWAHPDDEAYLSAALMASARDAGRRVVVATATWGELGTDDPRRWAPDVLAAERSRELRRSLAAVGVVEHHHLGHRDGECASVDEVAAVAALVSLFDRVRPDTVVTFGPEGMTGHPDHRAVSRWTTAAWRATGRQARLWYATVTPEWHARWGALNEQVGVWMEGTGPCTPADRLAHLVQCRDGLADRKRAALAAHATQTAALRQHVGADVFDSWWSTEAFVDAG